MKKIILLLFCCLLLFSGCGKKEVKNDDFANITKRGKLIVGVRDDAAPFGFKDNKGNLTGYDIDLARIIAEGILSLYLLPHLIVL